MLHRPDRRPEEVAAVVPGSRCIASDSKEDFVHDLGRFQSTLTGSSSQRVSGHDPEILVDHDPHPTRRIIVAGQCVIEDGSEFRQDRPMQGRGVTSPVR